MTRFATIDTCEMCNGKYVGVSVYFQGCSFHCDECFNPSTWDFHGGEEWTEETEQYVLDSCKKEYIKRLSLIGGEPCHPYNIQASIDLLKKFKELYPYKQTWVWTGYTFNNIPDKEILQYTDYIIDGQFNKNKKDLSLAFKGSSNQKIWKKENNEWKVIG